MLWNLICNDLVFKNKNYKKGIERLKKVIYLKEKNRIGKRKLEIKREGNWGDVHIRKESEGIYAEWDMK